ncbi:titin-like [Haemaphysalis longicornis]
MKTLHFMLRVIDKPVVSSTSMKLSNQQSQLVVTLQCTLHAVPHALLYWSKDGNPFNTTGKNHEVTHTLREYGEASTSLIVRNVGTDNVGVYRCHAGNSVGRRSARFVISKDIINAVVIEPAEEGGPTEMPDTKRNVGTQTEGAHPASPPKDTGLV